MHIDSPRIVVVGAGLTGLTAARRLTALGYRVTVVEQSDRVGGRAATDHVHGCAVDTGAQHLRLPDSHPLVRHLVLDDLPHHDLLDIGRPVWVFDVDGDIREGDAQQNAEPKWTYRWGLEELGRLLSRDLDIQIDHVVTGINETGDGYRVMFDEVPPREADVVLITCPAPEALHLLDNSHGYVPRLRAARIVLETATFRPIVSVTLGYAAASTAGSVLPGGSPSDPRPYYALVNIDRKHPISWLGFENDKGPDRAPDGITAVVAQMGPDWSRRHWEEGDHDLAHGAAEAVATLLGGQFVQTAWHDVRRWPHALPDTTCALDALNHDHQGLLFAGDYVAGGRLHLAMQAGLDIAAMIDHQYS